LEFVGIEPLDFRCSIKEVWVLRSVEMRLRVVELGNGVKFDDLEAE
jgi:hypothetical protein